MCGFIVRTPNLDFNVVLLLGCCCMLIFSAERRFRFPRAALSNQKPTTWQATSGWPKHKGRARIAVGGGQQRDTDGNLDRTVGICYGPFWRLRSQLRRGLVCDTCLFTALPQCKNIFIWKWKSLSNYVSIIHVFPHQINMSYN